MDKGRIIMGASFVILLFVFTIVTAAAPTPHNVMGRVFHSDGVTGVDNGFPVRINNTDSGDVALTYVYAPPIPSLKGYYLATINGSDNDNIIVISWNGSHYGTNTSLLASTTTSVNVVINTTRPSETNVTILTLEDNDVFNLSNITQISAQISIIGGSNGIDCYAVLNISNSSVLNLSGDTYSHYLGNIDLGDSTTTDWDVVGLEEGSLDIVVNAYCDSDGILLDQLHNDSVTNLTLFDSIGPIIELISPENNTALANTGNPTTFTYNVTDGSEIANCSLLINNTVNWTNSTVQKGIEQYFYQTLPLGSYTWSVTCVDNGSLNMNTTSAVYNITVSGNRIPSISNMVIDDPIDLTIGGIKKVFCNASVNDDDNISDIASVNSTLYHILSEANAPDDNNDHYTNSTCTIVSSSKFQLNYSCGYSLYYYANQGIWSCNITAYDESNNTGSSRIDTNVNELVALNISPSFIEYGELEAGNTSEEDENLTITNLGNADINISLEGYAEEEGDGLSMNCQNNNISVEYEKYSVNFGDSYEDMINLTSSSTQIANFTLLQRTNDTNYKNDRNNTYWKISIPLGASGPCNGTINLLAIPT